MFNIFDRITSFSFLKNYEIGLEIFLLVVKIWNLCQVHILHFGPKSIIPSVSQCIINWITTFFVFFDQYFYIVWNVSLAWKIQITFSQVSFREDTHKKMFFFSGRITKGVGRVNREPPWPLNKKPLFFSKIRFRLL